MSEGVTPRLDVRVRQSAPIPLDAAFSLAPHEAVALVGPSGSGKTTMLRCIAGLSHPAEGEISCDGEVWTAPARGIFVPPQRRSVGLVFQNYALFPHMTALVNVMCALGGTPGTERRARAREMLDAVGLGDLSERRPGQMSGGQQQRVALARALVRKPAVLLLDEPFSAVDRRTRRTLQALVADLRTISNAAIILVTHDLDEAAVLADRILVMNAGRIVMDGRPEEVLAKSRDAEAAGLLDL